MDAKLKRAKAKRPTQIPPELLMAFWDFLLGSGNAQVLAAIHHLEKRIMATQAELATRLAALKAQNDKAAKEIAAAFKKLQDALEAAGNTTPEVDAAVEALAGSIQSDDDQNADEVVEPPVEPTP